MVVTHKYKKANGGDRKTKKVRGGKTFSSNQPVKLNYDAKEIICEVCNNNNYTETIGTISKSKVRQGFGEFFFGEVADIIDNTSVIIYTCNGCGLCKIIRNKDPLRITATNLGVLPQ